MPTITSEIIIAYSQCPRKAYLLLFEKEQGITVEYIELIEKRKQNHQEAYLNSITTISSEIVLSQMQELEYRGKSYLSKVTLQNSKFVKPLINPIEEWSKTFPSEAPPVILNKYCPYCQFQVNCRKKAEQVNDLSLLASMTAKSWQRYHKRGIFTIKQLSYLYKPKR